MTTTVPTTLATRMEPTAGVVTLQSTTLPTSFPIPMKAFVPFRAHKALAP